MEFLRGNPELVGRKRGKRWKKGAEMESRIGAAKGRKNWGYRRGGVGYLRGSGIGWPKKGKEVERTGPKWSPELGPQKDAKTGDTGGVEWDTCGDPELVGRKRGKRWKKGGEMESRIGAAKGRKKWDTEGVEGWRGGVEYLRGESGIGRPKKGKEVKKRGAEMESRIWAPKGRKKMGKKEGEPDGAGLLRRGYEGQVVVECGRSLLKQVLQSMRWVLGGVGDACARRDGKNAGF